MYCIYNFQPREKITSSNLDPALLGSYVFFFFFARIKHIFFPCQQNAGIAINGISALLQTSLASFFSLLSVFPPSRLVV